MTGGKSLVHPIVRRCVSLLLALAVLAGVMQFPMANTSLAVALIVYAAVLFWRFELWLVVVPALLPVLDFAPWSGALFVDEFDLFVVTTIAVWLFRPTRQHSRCDAIPKLARVAFFALALSYGVSTLVAWAQPAFFDAAVGCHLYNFCGSLRILKGFVFAVLLLAPLRDVLAKSSSGYVLLAAGVLLGLFAESLALGIERILFTGLWNFDAPFRVTGTFSSLHTGGQHLDAYLVMTIPFIALLLVVRRASSALNALLVLLGIGLFVLAIYAVFATVSRGAIVAALVGVGILIVGGMPVYLPRIRTLAVSGRVLVTAVVLLVMAGASLSVALDGRFLSHRFANVSADLQLRGSHWRDVLSLTDPSVLSRLFGSGLASYPPAYARVGDGIKQIATFSLQNASGADSSSDGGQTNRVVRLSGGDLVYFEQRVDIEAFTTYRLSMDLQTNHHNTIVIAALCEKSLRYSVRCVGSALGPVPQAGPAFPVHDFLYSEQVGDTRGELLSAFVQRPVTLSFFVPKHEDFAMIDNIRLLAPDGSNLLENGDFDSGFDRWFFTADDADAWHVANLWLHLYFEQGLFGMIAFSLLIGAAVWRAAGSAISGNVHALILFSSLCGFLLIAIFGSLLDAPRLTLLVYLFIAAALYLPRSQSAVAE